MSFIQHSEEPISDVFDTQKFDLMNGHPISLCNDTGFCCTTVNDLLSTIEHYEQCEDDDVINLQDDSIILIGSSLRSGLLHKILPINGHLFFMFADATVPAALKIGDVKRILRQHDETTFIEFFDLVGRQNVLRDLENFETLVMTVYNEKRSALHLILDDYNIMGCKMVNNGSIKTTKPLDIDKVRRKVIKYRSREVFKRQITPGQ